MKGGQEYLAFTTIDSQLYYMCNMTLNLNDCLLCPIQKQFQNVKWTIEHQVKIHRFGDVAYIIMFMVNGDSLDTHF